MSSLTKLTEVAHEGGIEVKCLDLLSTIVGVITTLNDTVVNLSEPKASLGVARLNLHHLDRTTNVKVLLIIKCQIVGFAFPNVDEGQALARVDDEVRIHALSLRNLAYVHAVNSVFRINNDSRNVSVKVEDHHFILLTGLKGNKHLVFVDKNGICHISSVEERHESVNELAVIIQRQLVKAVGCGRIEKLRCVHFDCANTPDILNIIANRVFQNPCSLLLDVDNGEDTICVSSDEESIVQHKCHIIKQAVTQFHANRIL